MTTNDIAEDFRETLGEYEAWVNKNFELSEGWDDEVFYIVTVRDDLHELAEKLHSQSVAFDAERLKEADQRWQRWLLDHTQKGYKMIVKREDKPKTQWWWWVDELADLTPEQRATL